MSNNQLPKINFPNESVEYRNARNKLLEEEVKLRRQVEKVAQLRRQLPLGGLVKDYVFTESSLDDRVTEVRLSELFENGKNTLVIYSFMFNEEMEKPCPSCTSLIDCMQGTVEHLTQLVNFAVVAKARIKRIRDFADTRGWTKVRLLSSSHNDYNKDYHAENIKCQQLPICNIFVQTNEGIRHFYATELLFVYEEGMNPRHMDMMWPLWNYLDLTPQGRGTDWYPKLSYE